MADAIKEYGEGSMSMAVLREKHKKEREDLAEISAIIGEDGFMATKDKLSGDSVETKMASFEERLVEIGDAEALITRNDQALLKAQQMRGTPQAPPVMTERHEFPGGPVPDGSMVKSGAPGWMNIQAWQSPFRKAMLDSEAVRKAFPENRLPVPEKAGGGKMPTIEFKMDAGHAMGVLKAFAIQTPMPIDRVAMPYMLTVRPLDYVSMTSEPGSLIYYHTPQLPTRPTLPSGTNLPSVRTRGALLEELNVTWDRHALEKQSLGIWMPLEYEDINDNASVMMAATEQLLIDVRRLIVQQLFSGTNAGNQWNGLIRNFSTASGAGQNTDAIPAPTGAAPNYTNADDIHPTNAILERIARLWETGFMPTVIFCGRRDYIRIRSQQRVERYLQTDYANFPQGDVEGIPLCLTDQLPANVILVVDTRPECFEIKMGQDIAVAMSDDFRFANNQRAIRVVGYGNIPVYQPLCGWQITGTENMRVIRP